MISKAKTILMPAETTQFQCDEGKAGTPGFSISSSGQLQFHGGSAFIACETGQNGGLNIYTTNSTSVTKCRNVILRADSCISTGSAPVIGIPAAPGANVTVPGGAGPGGVSPGGAGPGGTGGAGASASPVTIVSTVTVTNCVCSTTGAPGAPGAPVLQPLELARKHLVLLQVLLLQVLLLQLYQLPRLPLVVLRRPRLRVRIPQLYPSLQCLASPPVLLQALLPARLVLLILRAPALRAASLPAVLWPPVAPAFAPRVASRRLRAVLILRACVHQAAPCVHHVLSPRLGHLSPTLPVYRLRQ